MLNSSLGAYMLPVTTSLPTLASMVSSGFRALVSFDDDGVNAAYPNLWPGYVCDHALPLLLRAVLLIAHRHVFTTAVRCVLRPCVAGLTS